MAALAAFWRKKLLEAPKEVGSMSEQVAGGGPTGSAAKISISLVPYGVLGVTSWGSRKGPQPDANIAIVDPAGMSYIQETGPSGAGAASGAIYKWLGIRSWDAFPEDVRASVRRDCDAKLHRYGGKTVIHVVGPDFRQVQCTQDQATAMLSQAYSNTLLEFLKSSCSELRMLPISGGVFAGPFKRDIPEITCKALRDALRKIPPQSQQALTSRRVCLCIFTQSLWADFQEAARDAGLSV